MKYKNKWVIGITACLLSVCMLQGFAGCFPADRIEETEEKEDLSAYVNLMRRESLQKQFYFEQLSLPEQVWYRDIYLALSGMEEERELHEDGLQKIGEEGIDRVFNAVMNDHPEFFYVEGYTYTKYTVRGELIKITFSGVYTMNTYERVLTENKLGEVLREVLAGIGDDASDYEKVRYVYEYVIFHTDYQKEAKDNQNICSVLMYGESVCQGYAKTVQYLLNKLQVNATLVMGSVYDGEAHSFNLVEVDGKYYYVDATWGDASYRVPQEDTQAGRLPQISYDYLCLPENLLSLTHVIDTSFSLPVCDSMDANYYVQEGAYFTAYDEEAVEDFFEKAMDEGKSEVALMCADREVYETFVKELLTDQKIFRYYYTAGGKIAYTEDPEMHSLTFWLVNA